MQMIVQPVIVLAAWTMLVWLWLYIKRVPALRRSPIDRNAKLKVLGIGVQSGGCAPWTVG